MKETTPTKNNGWIEVRRPIAAMTLLLALGIGGVAGLWITGHRSSRGVNILLSTASAAAVSDQISFTSGFTPVVDRVLPSVVNISSARIVRFADSGPTSPFFFDPFFHEFFGGKARAIRAGSGQFFRPWADCDLGHCQRDGPRKSAHRRL